MNCLKLLNQADIMAVWNSVRAYSKAPQLCVVTFIQEYVKRTNVLRKGSTQLLLSYFKPHQPVSTETIGRWLKTALKNAGIEI